MRISAIVILLAAALAACTKHNPDTCCTTQAQCDSFGLDQIYPCDGARVCDPSGLCIAPQCATSAECTSPDAPICEGQLCVPKCTTDDECVGIAGKPYCASDGVCVGCEGNTECSAAAPVCDAGSHACRGCTGDSECASGVCIEADGVCAVASDLIYVTTDGTDLGSCAMNAPCASLDYALQQVSGTRNIIHIVGGNYVLQTKPVAIATNVTIDADGTQIGTASSATGPLFSVAAPGDATLEGMTATNTATSNLVGVVSGGNARIYDVTVNYAGGSTAGPVDVDGGEATIRRSRFISTPLSKKEMITCKNGGVVDVQTTAFQNADILTTSCQLTVARNVFDNHSDGSVSANGGVVIVENNLIANTSEFADAMHVSGALQGSSIRFNTFFNSTTVTGSASFLTCSGAVHVSSNIFAWKSTNQPTCPTVYSLFDAATMQQGTGNQSADVNTFFVSIANNDLHLSAASPARGAGESGVVMVDLEGTARPAANPDVGAYEAP